MTLSQKNHQISPNLLASAARTNYMAYLGKQTKVQEELVKSNKRKIVMEDIRDLQKKRAKLQLDVDNLLKSADNLSYEAEKTGKYRELCIKSNAFRTKASTKREEIQSLEEAIKTKQKEL